MIIQKDISLFPFNTFGIDAKAKYFVELVSVKKCRKFFSVEEFKSMPKLILGGGSNILFTKDFEGIVIKNKIEGIEVVKEDADFIYVKVGAGVVWHEFVEYCLKNNYAGTENLSLIPGTVGAAPMQNIGAYGVELKDVCHEVEAIKIASSDTTVKIFTNEDCRFGYRESIFKKDKKNQYIITSVIFRLRKKPVFNTSYGAIEAELKKMEDGGWRMEDGLSIQKISAAVCSIRKSKLPNPAELGNAGSFFKNPTVSAEKFESLKKNYPDIVGYPLSPSSRPFSHSPLPPFKEKWVSEEAEKRGSEDVKLAAGWLIEQCGWKGKRMGNAGVHKNQALVLVNYGGATGQEIYQLALQIQNSVEEKFGVLLDMEVNIV